MGAQHPKARGTVVDTGLRMRTYAHGRVNPFPPAATDGGFYWRTEMYYTGEFVVKGGRFEFNIRKTKARTLAGAMRVARARRMNPHTRIQVFRLYGGVHFPIMVKSHRNAPWEKSPCQAPLPLQPPWMADYLDTSPNT